MRVYVAVTSNNPLRIYMFDDGLARFATQPYSMDNIGDRMSHLTNYSLNKHSDNFVHNVNAEEDDVGNKWSIKALKRHMEEMGMPVKKMWKDIEEVIIKTLISSEYQIARQMQRGGKVKISDAIEENENEDAPFDASAQGGEIHRNACYELYGFDIMFDDTMKPWLIEVNIMPSLSSSSPLDRKIKHSVLTQLFHLLGIVHYDKSKYDESKKALLEYAKPSNGLTADQKYLLHDTEDELNRRGDFKRIYPIAISEEDGESNPSKYIHLHAKKFRANNELLAEFEKERTKHSTLKQYFDSIQ